MTEDTLTPKTKKCPYCAEEILIDAIKCRHCGEWMEKQENHQTTYSNFLPPQHLLIFSIASFGLYEIYWFYRTWKHLKKHHNLEYSPSLRVLSIFIPIYGLVVIYNLFDEIRKYLKDAGVKEKISPSILVTSWLLLLSIPTQFDNPLFLISYLSVWPIMAVQVGLNSYWLKEQQHLTKKMNMNTKEKIWCTLGLILFILQAITFALPK